MCYDRNLNYKGIKIVIGDCYAAVGFDWKDQEFVAAVKSRDERIWKILDWAADGNAELYNQAMTFDSWLTYAYEKPSELLDHLQHYEIAELQKLLNNPYLPGRAADAIQVFFDGTLRAVVREQKEREKGKSKKHGTPGYIYLIRADNGMYKIGKAKKISDRLKPFSVEFPMKWGLIHSFYSEEYSLAEAELHMRYADKRDVGEWFKLDADEVEQIKAIQDGQL